MSLLTPDQRAIFDETIRRRTLDVLNAGEEGLVSGTASIKGSASKENGRPGGRVKKGDRSMTTRYADARDDPCYALDKNDPNYDSAEEPYKLKATQAFPRTDVIVAYKSSVASTIEEYFSSADISETARLLDEMQQPLYQHYFVKRLVTMAMDRGDREKEAAAVLLSALYPAHVGSEQIARGFERLLESVDDLVLDVPTAAATTALFVARGIIDDILPPSFMGTLEGLIPGLKQDAQAIETITLAHGHLTGRHSTERVLRAWGDSSKSPLDAAKQAIQEMLSEYNVSGDVAEARRCLRALNAKYFHHEFVKRALVLCIEAAPGAETAPRLLGLLKVLGDSGEVTGSQMAIGFERMDAVVEDLVLDVPNAVDRLGGLRLMAKEEGIHPIPDFDSAEEVST
mmetsp:Transcript_37352/g.92359  ORF Transcript_37352/g.92359 Transcript_37352/m.92359 type:complete len:399 (+) Transcript_37352:383-1579(+)|eukprot:CAMPEP_0197590138 /NCGR_PEP_ID=MMETSP1326-20131121/10829_1 /TAXON_ID=1155430 /ORGANISM="Genus nov. species nov., Strain RCC2288" /LENGTH=398 /DNA_ID=CAMNT_0043155143 /DNA_START=387 /DNA_END=1583 /DNA_ORIENTATION=+